MSFAVFTTVALAAVLVAGCSPRPSTNNYGAAAGGLGAAIAGTALYRVVTGGCVAACTPGHVCDRQTGFCVATECSPACPEGQRCARDPDGRMYCEDDGLTLSLRRAGAAARFDAGTPDAGL